MFPERVTLGHYYAGTELQRYPGIDDVHSRCDHGVKVYGDHCFTCDPFPSRDTIAAMHAERGDS